MGQLKLLTQEAPTSLEDIVGNLVKLFDDVNA